MDCPYCKESNAYVGITCVECLNPKCDHFSERLLSERVEETSEDFKELFDSYDIDYSGLEDASPDDYYAYVVSSILKNSGLSDD